MTAYLASALVMGFFSGGHCLGMCGPLVLALPISPTGYARSLAYRVAYNTGRIITYTLLGIVVGIVGVTFSLKGWQTKISYIAGGMLIVFSLIQFAPFLHLGFFSAIHTRMIRLFHGNKSQAGVFRFLALGSVNGFLPCGMVTVALAASFATGDLLGGTLYMFFFGLGTFPVMLAASLFGVYLNPKLKRVLAFIGPLYGIALGALLLLRPAIMLPHCH